MENVHMTDETATIADQLAIHEVMYRYGMAVDRRDWDLYRQVFTDDASIDYSESGGPRSDLEAAVTWLAEVLEPFAGLHHNMTNHVVELEGDAARSCTYYLAVHSLADGRGAETVLVVGGFYQDRLRRTASGWRIAERVERMVWTDGPYPEGAPRPEWYGTKHHPLPCLLP
jgi:3-phenylpropionate/cinnamic acid dioxygenase small subunit